MIEISLTREQVEIVLNALRDQILTLGITKQWDEQRTTDVVYEAVKAVVAKYRG